MIKGLLKIICVVGVLAAILISASIYIAIYNRHSASLAEVEIRQGASAAEIATKLAESGVIGQPKLFELLVRVKGLGKKLRAGTYEFEPGTTLIMAFDKLAKGDVKQYPFTVIEGWTIKDIAKTLMGQPFITDPKMPDTFYKLATDPTYVELLGLGNLPSLEGYLFPDTYYLTKPMTAEGLIKRLTGRFDEVWKGFDENLIKTTGLTKPQIVTLASIVEKETGAAAERPLVASVFHNRLAKGMLLQSDPTIIYGLADYDGNIRKVDITNPHPYNTYVHAGLPPGPIANPGKASLEAVINPAQSNYLFFVSKNDGTHQFSVSLTDHSKAVMEYQVEGKNRQ